VPSIKYSDTTNEIATQKKLVKTLASDVKESRLANAKVEAQLAIAIATTLEQEMKMDELRRKCRSVRYRSKDRMS